MKARLEKLLLFLDQAIERTKHTPGGYAATVEEHRATVADALCVMEVYTQRIEFLDWKLCVLGPRSEGEAS